MLSGPPGARRGVQHLVCRIRGPGGTRVQPTRRMPSERSDVPAMTDPDPVDGLRPGMRAVVRRRIEHGVTDALGDIVALDADTVSVRTRRGVEVIGRAAVTAAKEVPPAPARRGAPHLAISMQDLERIMVEGMPPLERAELGGWLLRAGAGFTGRANSVLPLGDPGVSLSEAVDHCESWYDERGPVS